MTGLFDISEFCPVFRTIKDGDRRGYVLFARHYSFYQYKDGRRDDPTNRNRRLFVGPGEKLVLLTPHDDALFVWRKFRDNSGQIGVNCAVFRNESNYQSSFLIREAERLAWARWPRCRLYTYVNPRKIISTNPGYCFKQAGWLDCGRTKNGLAVLEKEPFFRKKRMSDLKKYDLGKEQWREYDIPGREEPYRIVDPVTLFAHGGSTHRVLDNKGMVHCVPAPGIEGCVLRWQPRDASEPVQF